MQGTVVGATRTIKMNKIIQVLALRKPPDKLLTYMMKSE